MKDYDYKRGLVKRRKFSWVFYFAIFAFLGGGMVVGSAHIVLNTDIFKVGIVEVDKTVSVLNNDFINILEREIVGSSKILAILGPDNTLFWKLANLSEYDFTPGVSNIKIDSDILSKKINISVEKRDLFGIWCSLEKCLGFDKDGVVFSKAPDIDGFLILKIKDENTRVIPLGGLVLAKKEWIVNVLDTVKILSENDTVVSNVKIKNISLEEWEVEISSGLKFYFSLNFIPENLKDIVQKLDKKLSLEKLSYIDFRVPSRIYYR